MQTDSFLITSLVGSNVRSVRVYCSGRCNSLYIATRYNSVYRIAVHYDCKPDTLQIIIVIIMITLLVTW